MSETAWPAHGAQPAPLEPSPVRTPVARPNGATNQNPTDITYLALLREDYVTHGRDLGEQGLWAVWVLRFGNWRMSVRPRVLRAPFTIVYRFAFKLVEMLCGITLPYTVPLGRRVRIWHHGGMILHARRIGNDVHIRQNTTMGVARRDDHDALPVIEDAVDIGCGVAILGAVRVGQGACIGANAVVNRDVPAFAVAAGVPAKVIKMVTPCD